MTAIKKWIKMTVGFLRKISIMPMMVEMSHFETKIKTFELFSKFVD